MDKFDESSNNKKNSKKSRINDEDSKKNNQNTNDNEYEILKEENKKVLFDKLINNFSESFLVEQKLTTSRQSKIPYFKFNDKTIQINEDYNNIKELKKENKEYEIIKVGETKEIILGNDIIYGLTLISHYVVAVSKEYMKMYDLKDSNYKEVKSIFIKDVFFYCVDATKLNNIYYIVMGGNANSIFVYTINVENNNNDNDYNNIENNNNNKSEINENIEELIGHKNDINDLKFLIKHPNILLSASSDSTVRVWDIKKKKLICIYGGPLSHPSHVLTVDFHFSEQFIASAGFDQVIMFWDIDLIFKKYTNNEQNFKCLLITKPFFETYIHENYIDTVKFFGDLVLSKSTNGVILLWKPMFNDEKDHHFIIKKLFYTSSKIWYVKFHLNLSENLLFIGDVGGLYIFNLKNHKYSNAAMPDITAQIGSKYKNDILFRCVVYDNIRNLVITGKDNGQLCFTKLVKMTNNANETSS